jgi:hypothetical protein
MTATVVHVPNPINIFEYYPMALCTLPGTARSLCGAKGLCPCVHRPTYKVAVLGIGLRPLGCWNRGFETRCGHGHGHLLCLYVVLSCVGIGFCDGLITRPEESYRASNYMCDHINPESGPMFQLGTYRKMNGM